MRGRLRVLEERMGVAEKCCTEECACCEGGRAVVDPTKTIRGCEEGLGEEETMILVRELEVE